MDNRLKQQIRDLAQQGITRSQIADQLGIPYYTVANALRGTSLSDGSRQLKSWSHLYPEWHKLYEEGLSLREIATRFAANTMSVRVAVRGITRANRAVITHEDYFEVIDTPEKAYWLGMIAADGCVTERPEGQQWRVVLDLKQNDGVSKDGNEHTLLEKFKVVMGTTAVVVESTSPHGRRYSLCLTSDRMAMDLSMHGIFPLKGKNKTGVPIAGVPLKLYPSLARGLLDGDGTVALASTNLPSGYISWRPYLQFTGSMLVLDGLLAGLRQLGLVINKVKRVTRRGTNHLCVYGNDAKRLIEAMYSEAHKGPYLLRKWKRAHLHPSQWEDYTGKIPPIDQVKLPTGAVEGQGRKFDYAEIQRLRGEEKLSYKEIQRIMGCSVVVVFNALKNQPKMRVSR